MYVAVSAFVGSLGDNDFYSASAYEAGFMILYCLLNVVLSAYILGTVTMLMVKADERSKELRDMKTNLIEFRRTRDIPPALYNAMEQHLELHFHSEETNDENVLSIYPSSLRRRVLRNLYETKLQDCYLFKDCATKFFDAVLAAARIELFLPNVEILHAGDIVSELYLIVEGEGDIVSELYLIVEGEVNVMLGEKKKKKKVFAKHDSENAPDHSKQSLFTKRSSNFLIRSLSRAGSDATAAATANANQELRGESEPFGEELRGESEPFGEVAYFTEAVSVESVWTTQVTRVLVLNKAKYELLAVTFPDQSRLVVDNLAKRANEVFEEEFNFAQEYAAIDLQLYTFGDDAIDIVFEEELISAQEYAAIDLELYNYGDDAIDIVFEEELISAQEYAAIDLELCTYGDDAIDIATPTQPNPTHLNPTQLQVFEEELVSAQEYAAIDLELYTFGDGAIDIVFEEELILAQEYAAIDLELYTFGDDAIDIATQKRLMDQLKGTIPDEQTARLESLMKIQIEVDSHFEQGTITDEQAARLESLMEIQIEVDSHFEQALLKMNFMPDAANFDGRTGLMVAASEGHKDVVKIMLEQGANPMARDKAGRTALLEAVKGGHEDVVDLLRQAKATLNGEGRVAANEMCNAVIAGAHPDACNFDQRCALHVAAAEGNINAVRLLVEEGGATVDIEDRWGHNALVEAERAGARASVNHLRVSKLLNAASIGNIEVVNMMMRQGVDVDCTDKAYCGRTAIMLAVEAGHEDAVLSLLNSEASLNQTEVPMRTQPLE
eukprot:gene32551-17268_t